jgi:PEP-CTERM motif-containing protein
VNAVLIIKVYNEEKRFNMKKVMILVVVMFLGYFAQAQATQINIGTATYSGSDYNLIWDADNNGNSVIWLDYTSPLNYHHEQESWAAGLNAGGVLTYNIDPSYTVAWSGDWRLPAKTDQLIGLGVTTSEWGHLYYDETTGAFQNVIDDGVYWSQTHWNVNKGWYIDTTNGFQEGALKWTTNYAIAVREGGVANAVPEPTTMILFGLGLLGVAGVSRRKK